MLFILFFKKSIKNLVCEGLRYVLNKLVLIFTGFMGTLCYLTHKHDA